MHNAPDLNLASSYIPACLCLLKCSLAFILFILSPVRGWIGLSCLLMVDRLLWNMHAVLDVNAVCVALVGGLMVVHTRADGIHTVACMAVVGVWALVSALQILGLAKLHRSYEILLGACAVTLLSGLYQAQERPEWLALRVFVFVVANTTLPYLGVLMLQPDIDTYVNACRTLLVLLGDLEIAAGWVVVYILCIGYQMRAPKRVLKGAYAEAPPPAQSVSVMIQSPPAPVQDEAALLREALATRKGRDANL